MRYLLIGLMAVAFVVQIVGGYSPVAFGCGILFGGCWTMMLTAHYTRKMVNRELGTKSDT